MSDFKKSKITEPEMARYRISNLADRPNAFSSYRENKMSADDVKKAFDAQMEFLAEKHNALHESAEETAAIVQTISRTTFPVGFVYISFDNVSPATFFGGEWEELENERFLMTGEDTGLVGGSNQHWHSSITGTAYWSCENDGSGGSTMMWIENGLFSPQTVNRCIRHMPINEFEPSDVIQNTGVQVGGQSNYSKHLPPYITVHMWRRIA
jgi:hypothetical protein